MMVKSYCVKEKKNKLNVYQVVNNRSKLKMVEP